MTASSTKSSKAMLSLAALGVVFGDIGTSPLYTVHEIFAGSHHSVPITPVHVMGILSVMLWSLVIVVTLKYVNFMMRADNRGEGGIMALMALVLSSLRESRYARYLMLLGLFGAALFYGDSVITPAISVLSAVEGLAIATPAFEPYIVPISLGVLFFLFVAQKQGTARIGVFFGPVMILWFLSLATLGIINIAKNPFVLHAINPVYAIQFFLENPSMGFFSLGAVVLGLTGAEALYADMGHFGRSPVMTAWIYLVFPALLLNYYGQGALILADAHAIENPFYLLAPPWALYPMVTLATAATIIASQAVITGTYSLTQQAMQLGYAPRMEKQHTSNKEIGQIYLPAINWALMFAVAVLIVAFRSSSNLAAAYGVAVTGTMVITTILSTIVVRKLWKWNLMLTVFVTGFFLTVDIIYFSANVIKIKEGGWFPLLLGVIIFILLTTWNRGRRLLSKKQSADALLLDPFISSVGSSDILSIPGTAIFMTQNFKMVPHALLHSLKHYKSLHERVILLTAETLDIPYVQPNDKEEVKKIASYPNFNFYQVKIKFGFMDTPDIPARLEDIHFEDFELNPMDTSYFIGRETLIPVTGSEMNYWREKLFVAMHRNSGSAVSYFQLPVNRVVELGAQVEL
jgi:KUP system potassium uptake protein